MRVLARRFLVGVLFWAVAISFAVLVSSAVWWLWENIRLVVYALGAILVILVVSATGEIVLEGR